MLQLDIDRATALSDTQALKKKEEEQMSMISFNLPTMIFGHDDPN